MARSFSLYGTGYYDPRTSVWQSPDPILNKYIDGGGNTGGVFNPMNLSLFTYTHNNPVNLIDPDGEDIIPIVHGGKKNHRVGHAAVLIGDDKQGWTYFSHDYDIGKHGAKNDRHSIEKFSSIKEFANSFHNTHKKDYDDGLGTSNSEQDKNGKLIQRYTNGYRIKTSSEQDSKMKNALKENFKNQDYSLLGNDCTHTPQIALEESGLESGKSKKNGVDLATFFPASKHRNIIANNPGGTDISNQLKRSEQ